jgi:hypothetical protein
MYPSSSAWQLTFSADDLGSGRPAMPSYFFGKPTKRPTVPTTFQRRPFNNELSHPIIRRVAHSD